MICAYCRAKNSEEEHRCVRCGRRLHSAPARPAPETYPVVSGAAAPAYHASAYHAPEAEGVTPVESPRATERLHAVEARAPQGLTETSGFLQASLFGPQAVPRIVEPRRKPERRQEQSGTRAAKKETGTALQQALDFLPAPVAPRVPRGNSDAFIHCAAPVAPRTLRILAAAVDLSIIVCAIALFLAAITFGGVEIGFHDRSAAIVYGLVAGLTLGFYKALFVIANSDTPGVRCLRMRVVNFDGRAPTLRQRVFRMAGGCLSVVAATLGLLWALVDEESLSWHDHISRTFPTAYNPDEQD